MYNSICLLDFKDSYIFESASKLHKRYSLQFYFIKDKNGSTSQFSSLVHIAIFTANENKKKVKVCIFLNGNYIGIFHISSSSVYT